MDSWRKTITDIRIYCRNQKQVSKQHISIHDLENYLDDLEDDYQIEFQNEILEKINHPHGDVLGTYKRAVDLNIKSTAHFYDQHKKYTQVIITAGYALFFGLWSITKDYSDNWAIFLAGLMIAISASSFVLFEVFKTMLVTSLIGTRSRALINAKADDRLDQITNHLESASRHDDVINLLEYRVWLPTYWLSVLTGVVGIAVLLTSYCKNLWLYWPW
ncbi:hypothetical protein [Methylobacillus flagellatus]|uniref:hypothetical protein n=1 Tax=Methylobacillus flagellatus TaxID=405 RepID=UPI0010F63678|nr:hypothetical protein [Methylobacillus flagellatus]